MSNRRHLTPNAEVPAPGVPAMRRGGARHELTDRVTLKPRGTELTLEGWALNISRGGVRVILEKRIELGEEMDVTVGVDDGEPKLAQHGRVVWIQEEADGVVVGIEFVGLSGTHPSVPPPSPEGDC